MKPPSRFALTAAMLTTFVFAPAAMADDAATVSASTATPARPELQQLRVTRLIGTDVRNLAGERLGDLADLIIDIDRGEVRYAILSFGGFMGLGDRKFAYPLRAFRPGPRADELVLDVDLSKLQQAPGFDAFRWPDWDSGYYETVDHYFGQDSSTAHGRRLWRATDLVGAEVDDLKDEDVGHVVDLGVNLRSGKVQHAVVEIDRLTTLPDRRVAIPLERLRSRQDPEDGLVLKMTPTEVDRLAKAGDLLRSPTLARQVR